MGRELWYLLINGSVGQHGGAFADLYVYEDHLGAAVQKAKEYAQVAGLKNCQPVEAYPLSRIGYQEVPEDTERLAEGVFLGKGLNIYETDVAQPYFNLPTGILRSATDGILELELAEDHFEAHGPDEAGFYTLVVVLSGKNLEQLFFRLCGLMPEIDMLNLRMKNFYGDKQEDTHWVNPALKGKQPVLNFIKDNLADTFENGFLELVLYVLEGETCISLDDHKLLTLTTHDIKLFNFLQDSFGYFGIKKRMKVSTPQQDYEHWHYRPYNSLDEEGFTDLLIRKGFKPIKEASVKNETSPSASCI